MASTINASTSGGGGIISTADSSGTLSLQGGGNTGVSIDSSGNATGTTQSQANNSTRLSTTAYVDRVAVQQIQKTETGAFASGTTAIPFDDTIPQNTEGDQYMTVAITPKSATSTLVIDIVFNSAEQSGAVYLTVALFQDSTANALAAASTAFVNTNYPVQVAFRHYMTSGTTSATTFKVRAGGDAGTINFNGTSGARKLGGVMASSISVMEIGV
jgi:hypothetical protein